MSNSKEAPSEAEILFWAQASVLINPSSCKEGCKGGKIHKIREDRTIVVYCKGEACITSAESVKPMNKNNKGGSAG